MQTQIFNATITFEPEEDVMADRPGDSRWSFLVSDLEKIKSAFPALETSTEINEHILEADYDKEMVAVWIVDDAIMYLRAMAEIGGEYTVGWAGENIFWLCHDICHVRNDTGIGSDDVSIYVDEHRERRAHCEGAILAIKNGESVGDVIREIAKVAPEHEERFGVSMGELFVSLFASLNENNLV